MNTFEMKVYILRRVKELVDLNIMPYKDGSFFLSARSESSQCGALFLENGRMHPMARVSFSYEEGELMNQVEDAAKEFISRKETSNERSI